MMNGVDPDLPAEVLAVLPSDPYEQLDVARKITAMAIASRLSRLEGESAKLRQKLTEKEQIIYELQERLSEMEGTLQDTAARLSVALDEQARLATEKNNLAALVKKLTRDVAKLETFKKALMQSLQEDNEVPSTGSENIPAKQVGSLDSSSLSNSSFRDTLLGRAQSEEDKSAESESLRLTSSKSSSALEDENHSVADVSRPGVSPVFPLTPSRLTPQLTPTGSPKKQSAASSPREHSGAGSPKRQFTSETTRYHSVGEARASYYSSQPTSKRTTAPNSPPGGSLPARTPRVDGKEFFRQARNRLSYEQFSAFLSNIKELNAHRQTREETLRKADEIFGTENKDLYASFDSLLNRHLPAQV